jgi:spore coat polysaccharide biosynthesis protein SpsF (cytidylyltransferase family)
MSAGALIVLQARMHSTRLPGKALASIGGRSILAHCIARLRQARAGAVVVATTVDPADDAIAREARRFGAGVFRGSAGDVLARFAACVSAREETVVVRATADNPAVDSGSVTRVLARLAASKCDHVVEDGLPYGGTVEAMTRAALQRAHAEAASAYDREHVTPYIRHSQSGFHCVVVRAPEALCRPELRFSVDTEVDLSYMRAVFGGAVGRHPHPLGELIASADRVAASARDRWRASA